MKDGTIIAFREKDLGGKIFAGLRTTILRIGGSVCIGIPRASLGRACDILGISPRHISKILTRYEGVCLAKFSRNGHASVQGKPKEAPQDVLKRKYMQLCGYNRKAERVRGLKQETIRLRTGIEKCQERLVSFLRRLEEKQQQLQVVAGTDDASLARFGDEFEQLTKHPDIQGMEIVGKKVVAYTRPIFINYLKVNYDIGRFKITIDSGCEKGTVRMINLTRTLAGHHHPHIQAFGEACLGNIQEVLPHMIAEHKYAAALSVCIQYLKSYECSENYRPYLQIQNWPVAKTKKGTKDEKKL